MNTPTQPTIEVLYTCAKCGVVDRPVMVVERGIDEPITDWMTKVQLALSKDHVANSPKCHITSFTNAKIPLIPGSDLIGRAARH